MKEKLAWLFVLILFTHRSEASSGQMALVTDVLGMSRVFHCRVSLVWTREWLHSTLKVSYMVFILTWELEPNRRVGKCCIE